MRSVTRGYYAMITEVDHWVGQIIRELKALHLYDNTIIVFNSDHGEWLGEHLRYSKGYWAPDVISRVPLIIRIPEALGGEKGTNIKEIVECVDIVPTLLDAAGIPIPGYVQGDILPVRKSRNGKTEGDGLGLCEYHGWKSLRSSRFRYVAEANGKESLFDLNKDPMEYNNVAENATYTEDLCEMRRLLIKRMLNIEAPLPREWPY